MYKAKYQCKDYFRVSSTVKLRKVSSERSLKLISINKKNSPEIDFSQSETTKSVENSRKLVENMIFAAKTATIEKFENLERFLTSNRDIETEDSPHENVFILK
jgi:hypothetical protein